MGPSNDDTVIQRTHELRAAFEALRNSVQELKQHVIHNPTSNDGEVLRCISLCYTELQSAGHWTGEILGALGIKSNTNN